MTTKRKAKDPAAVSLGSKGGRRRAQVLSASRRSEIAMLASAARWLKAAKEGRR